jgi:hypothetical protein
MVGDYLGPKGRPDKERGRYQRWERSEIPDPGKAIPGPLALGAIRLSLRDKGLDKEGNGCGEVAA